ncbi:MAG TPA: hypothetical protein VEK07_17030 [Polyangiaceae bacterium]|nr:hypothetical protein [Polyangiaceae bacterium]
MKTTAILGLMMVLAGTGCASTSSVASSAERGWSGVAWHDGSTIRVGEAHVMATRLNPLARIGLASQGGAIAVSYEPPGRARTVALVDAESLQPAPQPEGLTSPQPDGARTVSNTPDAATPARVALEGGRFVLVWKRGSADWGYRALAQEFASNGTALGVPVPISPPNVDVMGMPQAVTTDGRHVVATFAGATDRSVELMAVPIEVPSALEPIAGK